jgi:Tfp pilus assembly protein PilV
MTKRPVLRRDPRGIGKQGGTTMMEVMVATLVLSAGLLGLAAMQTRAIQTASGLATQQVMAQALGSFGEAQLADPNYSLVTDSNYCRKVWMDINTGYLPTPKVTEYLNKTFLANNTPCGSAALEVHTDYRNYAQAPVAPPDLFQNQNAKECDYIAPQTRILTCTLMTGESIRLENLVWIR